MKPFAWRLLVSTFLGAAFGALWGLLFPDLSLVILGLIPGFFSGLLGLGWKRILLGTGTGLAVGLLTTAIVPALNAAVLGGLVVFGYRLLAAWLFRGQEAITVSAERVLASEIRYVVPSKSITTSWVGEYSKNFGFARRFFH